MIFIFENEVIISEVDKNEALYHIRAVNKILNKYPYCSCYANTVTTVSRAKTYSKNAEEWIGYLHTPITEKYLTDCSIKLKEMCLMNCGNCVCRDCDKRFDCDGGNSLTGCGE